MADKYTVHQDDYALSIYRNNSEIWSHSIRWAAKVLDLKGCKVSEVILHLEEKAFTNASLLYEFAKCIQQLHPDNDIDWYATFEIVERHEFIDQSFEMKRKLENKEMAGARTTRDMADEAMEHLQFSRESGDTESKERIHEILVQRLKDHGLPFETRPE